VWQDQAPAPLGDACNCPIARFILIQTDGLLWRGFLRLGITRALIPAALLRSTLAVEDGLLCRGFRENVADARGGAVLDSPAMPMKT
jgi:hypothetical protein